MHSPSANVTSTYQYYLDSMTGGEQQGWVILHPTFIHERNGWLYKCFGQEKTYYIINDQRTPVSNMVTVVEDNQNSNMEDDQHHTTTAIIHPVGRGLFKLIL